jgi:hypothetical protein
LLPRAIADHISAPRRFRPSSMQKAEQVQQNDDKDRHAGQPQDDIAQHE